MEQDQPLNIQAKSILNPQAKNEQSVFLNKIALQQRGKSTGGKSNFEDGHDQFFIDTLKDIILKTQVNEWRLRLEAQEALFELIN